MTSVEPDGSAVRQALEHASERAAGLVRDGAPLDGPVPGTHCDLSARRPAPWYGPDIALPVGNLLSLAVSEFLVHGYDLARAVGAGLRPSAATTTSATAVAAAVMSEMLPRILDQRRASGFTGSFEIRVRGGERFVLRIADGMAWSEPAGSRDVDCVISLSAYHALLMGYDRVPAWRAIASGKASAFGRRPWLGLRFDHLFLKV